MTVLTTPYGAWSSPITAELITAQSVGLGSALVAGDRVIWAASQPGRGGQISLIQQLAGEAPVEIVGDPYSVRTRVHEYGGGAWAVSGDVLVFSNFADNRLYRLDLGQPDAQPAPLGPDEPGLRFAALSIPRSDLIPGWPRGLLLAVREDHRTGSQQPTNTVVALSLEPDDPRNAEGGVALCSGADFYADPVLSADGRLAWVEWDHPSMPWDATRLKVGTLNESGVGLDDVAQAAGGDQESAVHPGWTPAGDLVFISDPSGWWNLYRRRHRPDGTLAAAAEPLHPVAAEFCPPPWMLGSHPYLILDDARLVCSWSEDNIARLGLLDLESRRLVPIANDAVTIDGLHSDGRALVATLGYADAPRSISLLVDLDHPSAGWTTLVRSTDVEVSNALISRAEPVTWDGADGPVYAWFYPPTNPEHEAAES